MKAFIFDLNGTMIHDMEYHTRAWQYLLNNDLGGNFTWEEVKPQMYGKNQEVLVRLFGPDRFTEAEMQRYALEKEKRYQQEFWPHLRLLPGLAEFLADAHRRHIPMAIGSAAIPFNIDFVLDNLHIRHYFTAVVSADDVTLSKPHPETFFKAADALHVAPADCIVFEDVPKGVEAARNAGMPTVVLTTTHQESEFAVLDNVLHFAADFHDPIMKTLL
ncbi:HAD-superfamily hydrolase, subfamily IA, variant 3 [Hymenobacter roseosalivarius DSM 11622]|uniref:HAD-superfamily hydrolase, subfamily IA, variant 3 n=1 Tax=Hymenobacter roseosalivarius DSM 11622 TaxID=645990 RepID=A0A1W1VFA5_9BACT|nr:HAD family phosphatase [Hymenobacter roseosalivarius]SMB91751.1 HAD-superfamily hydrolase, subfamily IA, variant 3 [Hymenobacter roseosalivarius DSM 11622]